MKRIAITGAASGIGLALAERFGRGGYVVIGIDVDREAADRARFELVRSGCEVSFLHADLASQTERLNIVTELEAGGPLDGFIHNAGINSVGSFEKSDLARERTVLDVNLVAPMTLTAELLRYDRLAPRASLVFVSSLSHFVGYPGAAAYAASKDGLASYARSLSAGTMARGLHVLTVFPGPTKTEHAKRHSPEGSSEERRMPPAALAERVWKAVKRRRRVLIPGVANRTMAAFGHAFPKVAEGVMRKTLYERLEQD